MRAFTRVVEGEEERCKRRYVAVVKKKKTVLCEKALEKNRVCLGKRRCRRAVVGVRESCGAD